jgi:hypothetical protein
MSNEKDINYIIKTNNTTPHLLTLIPSKDHPEADVSQMSRPEKSYKIENTGLVSKNNYKCLTKCTEKNTLYTHPVLNLNVLNETANTCAVEPFYSKSSTIRGSQLERLIAYDECDLNDNKNFVPIRNLTALLFNMKFDPTDFLISLYNIHSFDQTIYWTMENSYLPYYTIKRVHDISWKVYGKDIINLSDKVFDYYYNLIKNKWYPEIVPKILKKFIFKMTSNEKLHVDKKKNISDESSPDIDSIIFNNYFIYQTFVKMIKKYIKIYKDDWDVIMSHYDNLQQFFFKYLVHIIKKSNNL